MEPVTNLKELHDILRKSRTIAIVGLSPKPQRPSNVVARYLIEAGYTVFPVNPGQDTILGLSCYADITSIPEHVDIVDIFRKPDQIPAIVEQAISCGCHTIWMQLNIINEDAAQLARKHGLHVFMNRCIKVDHQQLFPQSTSP